MVSVDIRAWRRVLEEVVGSIADEGLQRRAWFGLGPEIWSPEEAFNQLFGDAAIKEFLVRDTGLDDQQIESGWRLVRLMDELSKRLPKHPSLIDPSQLIDDPSWKEVREAAAQFYKDLITGEQQRGTT